MNDAIAKEKEHDLYTGPETSLGRSCCSLKVQDTPCLCPNSTIQGLVIFHSSLSHSLGSLALNSLSNEDIREQAVLARSHLSTCILTSEAWGAQASFHILNLLALSHPLLSYLTPVISMHPQLFLWLHPQLFFETCLCLNLMSVSPILSVFCGRNYTLIHKGPLKDSQKMCIIKKHKDFKTIQ